MDSPTVKAASGTTRKVVVKRPPSSTSTPSSSKAPKKSRTSLVASSSNTVITPATSSSQPITLNVRRDILPGSSSNNAEAANTRPETSSVQGRPNDTAALIGAYSEISDSFASLMERLKEVNQAQTARGSSLSTENRMFLSSVESSLVDTMKKGLNEVATSLKTPRLKR